MSVVDFYSRVNIIPNEGEIIWFKPKFCPVVTLSIKKKHLKKNKGSLQRDCGIVDSICRTSVIILFIYLPQ